MELEPGSFRDRTGRIFYAGDEVYRALTPREVDQLAHGDAPADLREDAVEERAAAARGRADEIGTGGKSHAITLHD